RNVAAAEGCKNRLDRLFRCHVRSLTCLMTARDTRRATDRMTWVKKKDRNPSGRVTLVRRVLIQSEKDSTMNKDQVKGGMKEAAGKAQKEFGKAVDSPKHTIEGGMKEAGGKVQKAAGDMKEDARKMRKEADKQADKRGF